MMVRDVFPEGADPFFLDGLILQVRTGSRAYGLSIESSDEDSRGVCVVPKRFLLGLDTFEQQESEGNDHVIYALAKFARLALQGNPNILEGLFTPDRHVLHRDELGDRLVANRQRFLSRKAGERFGGYARGQFQRMERHRRWLVDPPPGPPDPAAFGATSEGGQIRFPHTGKRKAFDAEQAHWNHYATWRRERNVDRAKIEAAHGYDTKHAVHLIRLLRMGEEVLTRGEVLVERPDAEELLEIRHGDWSYERVLEEAKARTAALPALVKSSPLPETADHGAVGQLVIELHAAGFARFGS